MSGHRSPADEATWLRMARLAELGLRSAELAHELRQPLFAIKAMIQLEPQCARREELLQQIGWMEELLGRYTHAGSPEEAAGRHDLNGLLLRPMQSYALRGQRLGIELRTELAPEPLWVRCRPGSRQQVVLNLLQNAVDAVLERPEPAERAVVLRTLRGDGRVCIQIDDTGPGLAASVEERAFEPFVTSKPQGRGTGLGLFISRRLVEASDGTLSLGPAPESGTRAEIVLPMVE